VSEQQSRIEAAEREAQAAIALAEDPLGPRTIARDHILAGWRLLVEGDPLEAKLPYTSNAAVERLRALRPDDDPLRAATDLVRAVAVARREHGLATPRPRWRAIAATTAGLFALAVLAILATRDDGREGPWRASYFSNPDLEGDAIEQREGDIEFYWHRRAPIEGMPVDGFSARFESCLLLEEPVADAAFQIASDDGARVIVDDVVIVDDWSAHQYRSRGEIVSLEAGVHRIVAEVAVVLVASLDGDVPKPIPGRMLELPGDSGCE
jgi:hypothetical protein